AFIELNNTYKLSDKLTSTKPLTGKTVVKNVNEQNFLKRFESICLAKGLVYNKQDLINFHTAMKTQSMVILSGMSGIGKSKLVQCYYETFNYDIDTNNTDYSKFLFVPVIPFWQDDSDLIGYLDTLNHIYRPGESGLIDFIIEASQNQNELYIVCFDEMNLAKVEHYFSQFISILEREQKQRVLKLYNKETSGRVFNQLSYPS